MSNPLFKVASNLYDKDYTTREYESLTGTDKNLNTYTLGFCRGVEHASSIFQIQIEMLQQQVKALSNHNEGEVIAPTLERQNQ